MPTISYHALNGRISSLTVGVDPNATGPSIGGRIDVLGDALGSVIRTMHDEPQNGGETLRYAAYGSVLYEAGAWAPPRSGWVGSLGYRSTQMRHAEQYVRARHYATSAGRWTTVDPLWPDENAYGYVSGNPTNGVDPSGLKCGDFRTKVCVYPQYAKVKTTVYVRDASNRFNWLLSKTRRTYYTQPQDYCSDCRAGKSPLLDGGCEQCGTYTIAGTDKLVRYSSGATYYTACKKESSTGNCNRNPSIWSTLIKDAVSAIPGIGPIAGAIGDLIIGNPGDPCNPVARKKAPALKQKGKEYQSYQISFEVEYQHRCVRLCEVVGESGCSPKLCP